MKKILYINYIFFFLFANDIQADPNTDTQNLQKPSVSAQNHSVGQPDKKNSKKDAAGIESQKTSEPKKEIDSPSNAGSQTPSEPEKRTGNEKVTSEKEAASDKVASEKKNAAAKAVAAKKSTADQTSKTSATTAVVSKTTTVSATTVTPAATPPTTAKVPTTTTASKTTTVSAATVAPTATPPTSAAAPTTTTASKTTTVSSTGAGQEATAAAPATTTATKTTTISTTATASKTTPTPEPADPIDCAHPVITISEQNLSLWGQYAATKAFEYRYDQLDNQLEKLKSCFTPQGWTGFHEALQQSGNISIIKNQQLSVSSQIVGKAVISPLKDNQWKIVVPVEVVYQNDQEKFSQSLAVMMVVTKKSDNELGIVQLIATITSDEMPSAT